MAEEGSTQGVEKDQEDKDQEQGKGTMAEDILTSNILFDLVSTLTDSL